MRKAASYNHYRIPTPKGQSKACLNTKETTTNGTQSSEEACNGQTRAMLCIGLLGCSHAHHSAKVYIVMTLVVVATIFGIRVLIYIIDRCLLRPGQQGGSPTPSAVDEFEMRLARAALAMHRSQQQWRRPVATTEFPQPSLADNWQSKLVITAGSDYASHIAHPCPFRERPS